MAANQYVTHKAAVGVEYGPVADNDSIWAGLKFATLHDMDELTN
jgi:hypothetical protein